ncbi:FAD-binding protein [Lentzea sp. JNUCC 0626]|uniref:FAD-dependent oxidoreductase n=1 Tax=Lentzea sp. JNUCC 0626 TaxID=3367513 RepID=UPI003747FBF3
MTVPSTSELRASIDGPVLLSGEDGFAEEVAAFNLAVSYEPQIVIGATNAADVQTAVRFAAAAGRSVAVLNTGSGPARDVTGDAVLITTRRMSGMTIDADRRTARVQVGVRWGQVVAAAAESGLVPLAGSSPEVGVVGYTLGGGSSVLLGRKHGYNTDHVHSIDVVTADGEFRHVTRESGGLFFTKAPDELRSSGAVPARTRPAVRPGVHARQPDRVRPAVLPTITNDPTQPGASVEHFALLDDLTPEALDAILAEAGPDSAGRLTLVDISQLDGAFANPPAVPNAVGRRDAGYALFALTVLPPDVRGVDQNLNRADADPSVVRRVYDDATYRRLQAIKAEYDPANTFRWNHNIPPA